MIEKTAPVVRCANCWYNIELPEPPVKVNDQCKCPNCDITFYVTSTRPIELDQLPKLEPGVQHVWNVRNVSKGVQVFLKDREMICMLMDKAFEQGLQGITVRINFAPLARYAAFVEVVDAE